MMLRQPNQRQRWGRSQRNGRPGTSTRASSVNRRPWYWWLSWVLFIAALVWAAYPIETSWDRIRLDHFAIGQPSPYTVLSPVTVNYEDLEASQQAQVKAMSDVPPVYRLDTARLADVTSMFQEIRKIRTGGLHYDEEKKFQLQRLLLIGHLLSDETLGALISLPSEKLSGIESNVETVLGDVLHHGVIRDRRETESDALSFAAEVAEKMQPHGPVWAETQERLGKDLKREATDAEVAAEMSVELHPGGVRRVGDLHTWSEAKAEIQERVSAIEDLSVRSAVAEMSRILIRPNVVTYDAALTQSRRQSIALALAPVRQEIRKGQLVVAEGQVVTEQHFQALQTIHSYALIGGVQYRVVLRTVGGVALLLTILSGLMFLYLGRYQVETSREYRRLLAFCLAILLTTVSGKAFVLIAHSIARDSSLTFDFALVIPAAMTSALVTILFGSSTAIVSTILVASVIGLMGAGQTGTMLLRMFVTLAAGFVPILSLSQVRRRRELTVAGLYVAVVNALCIAGASLLLGTAVWTTLQNVGLGIFSGLLVAVVTPGLLPLFEFISRVTTGIKLLELSDLNHPLLKELEQRAIGTYHHSMNVSKLAEAAAKAIGANELLARVGAYYHDIGKMAHPRYFSENQEGGANPHDKLGAARSAKIIANHVLEGIQLAREHKLPKTIESMIPEHHGTALISFFHLKALQNDKNTDFKEDDFRYAGPKPRSKEASIMMLADSVEAASRSLYNRVTNPTPQNIKELIQQIINKKTVGSQLDQSSLTLEDLQIITETFERVLCGFYHSRIDYPKDDRLESPMLKAVMTNGVDKQRSVHPFG